eukprot:CAMPEP_0173417188 /NCGR_PEP_ID=MMETSP1356-20130122/85773_1 /TAXON_ID=77927 ORGANISM="Hemiselmis virescens, Strain PCC157" /NCGR_SAMPLE_ID=MMETSP1356 /ASSEMBLY_ACC=CAM_ASM_000847 /LENGTH=80 /DNA_ID=CAMNT_0014379511 /DNA_START=490 /DNA_END=728 /DNA_ORIENTATION=+
MAQPRAQPRVRPLGRRVADLPRDLGVGRVQLLDNLPDGPLAVERVPAPPLPDASSKNCTRVVVHRCPPCPGAGRAHAPRA